MRADFKPTDFLFDSDEEDPLSPKKFKKLKKPSKIIEHANQVPSKIKNNEEMKQVINEKTIALKGDIGSVMP